MNKYKEHKENNVITVTNNNVKYYVNLAKQHSEESKKYAIKSENYAKESLAYTTSHVENTANPHNVTSEQVGAYSMSEVDEILTAMFSQKNPNLVAGQNIVISNNDDGSQTISSSNIVSTNYEITENKPSINMVTLAGNKSSHDLGLASLSDLPVNVSELENDCGYLMEHQDISGKQDVLTAGDGISIENEVVSTVNRANTDLSNLTNIGKNSLYSQWVIEETVLSTSTAAGTYTIDLSDYIPNDGQNYEVLLNYDLRAGTSDGEHVYISSDIVTTQVTLAYLSTSTTTTSNGCLIMLVGPERTITYKLQRKMNDSSLKLIAFRRIGTHE